ncbi:MAG: hypothetical protein ACFFDF_02680 [Candidatus Odinarchaeota archaeon]
MNKKILSLILISLMVLQAAPMNYIIDFDENQKKSKLNNAAFIPPDNKEVEYSRTPFIHFSIIYRVDIKEVRFDIFLKNNLSIPITLFNLWIQVNKSDVAEAINIPTTKILESQDKLSLSTFDIDKSNDLYGNGSMIFHIKLFEGKVISVNEQFNIRLRWYDPDEILAQYDPNLIYNKRSDDIQVFFQHSTRVETYQPFPLIERVYNQKPSEIYEGYMEYILTFRVVNLMETNLETFNFKYVKKKDFLFEQNIMFSISSPYLDESQISDILLLNEFNDKKIENSLSFGESVVLEPYEWLNIRIIWIGDRKKSTIDKDFVIWDYGELDNINKGLPYYLIGFPFYPLLNPAEPIITHDYDNDGLKNYLEIANGFDPLSENLWLSWTSLRGDYSLNAQAANNLELTAEVIVTIPLSFSGLKLTMKVINLGLDDKITKLHVNDDLLFNTISSVGDFVISNSIDVGLYSIRFDLKHGTSNEDSSYEIKFYLGSIEIPDLSALLQPDSDGDGVFDILEEDGKLLLPDADLDGAFDGIDLMPDNYLSYSSESIFALNFPVKDMNLDSDIVVNLQIKPTINDYTDNIPYAGNELMIAPGIKIYGTTSVEGGDYLPDNSFTLDNGKTGIMHLIPLTHGEDGDYYSWGGNINYKYNNLAKEDHQILFKFSLVWLIFEYDTITGESNLYHVYDNNDPYIIQGISVMETEPTNIIVGVVGNGRNVRKTATYAEFLAHLYTSQISYNPADVSDLVYMSATVSDIQNLNNTRDNLRDQLANTYQLNYDETYFIYNTYGYSLNYNLSRLFTAFPGEDFTKIYTSQEIDDFYLLPENMFMGMAVMQFIKRSILEYQDQFVYGFKGNTETKTYDIQAYVFHYVGFSSDIVLHFIGTDDTDQIEIWYYDMDSKSEEITMSNTGGYFGYIDDLQVFRFQISKPEYTPPDEIFGDFILWTFYVNFYAPLASKIIRRAGVWLMLRAISLYIGGLNGKVARILIKYTYVNKITGGLDVIFGALRLIYGIGTYFQGAYNTGLKEGVRGYLMIVNGILWIAAEPTGLTKIAAIILTVFQIIDGILLFFGIDIWGWWFSTFFGIEDANPKYQITSNSVSWNTEKIQSQGGFEVGDSIGVNIGFRNTGNTQLTFGLQVKAGSGDYGGRQTRKLDPSKSGSLSAYDSFQVYSPTLTLTSLVDMSYYYDPPGKWGPVPWPPFIWYFNPDPVQGGPKYGDPNVATFDIPVFPNNLPTFVNLIKTGAWFPTDVPKAEIEVLQDEIIPGVSEQLEYKVSLHGASKGHYYVLETPEDDLWDYSFIYNGKTYEPPQVIHLSAGATFIFNVKVIPTVDNILYPVEDDLLIRITQEDLSLARINPLLHYKIMEIVDFEVVFDPEQPDETELEYNTPLLYFINVTNKGNIIDSYNIEIEGLESSLTNLFIPYYDEGAPRIYVRPNTMYSALLVIQIPYYEIIFPGMREFTIKVSSETDSSVLRVFDCSIEVSEYHKLYFFLEEAELSMTDSDTYIYNFDLVNLGNVNEDITISCTEVDIAIIDVETETISMVPGQEELFNIVLSPFELGYCKFNVTASSQWVSEKINLSINVVDDDTQFPYFENFFIKDNENWLNISFIAIDELLGDDQGLSNIDIYVDDILIHNYQPSPTETIFNFSFTNDWIWEEGIHNVRVDITDADNDRISEDHLTTIIYNTFEVTLDEMYKYVMWLCEEMNNYIYDNDITALYGVVTQKVVKIQNLLWEAYQLIEGGYLHTGLVRNKMAEIKLEIADTKTELMINKQSMSLEHFEYLKNCIQNIRNKIVELMGLSMGTEFSHNISLVAVDIYNFRDFVETNINATDSENLVLTTTLAAEKLEDAIFDISLDKDTESSLTSSQHALDKAKVEVVALQSKNKISDELKNDLLVKIWYLQWQLELLKEQI